MSAGATRRRACTRKRRHETFESADEHARSLRDADVKVYACRWCGGYHVGHVRQTPTPRPPAPKLRAKQMRRARRRWLDAQ